MNNNIHQMPPANIEAEEAVLGGIIIDPKLLLEYAFT